MGYKLKRILIYPDGVTEKQVYPATGWKPGANTIGYRPFNGDANDYSGNNHNLSSVGTVSYTTQLANGNYVATKNGAVEGVTSAFYVSMNYTNIPITMVGWCKTSGNGTSSLYGPNKWQLWYSDNNSTGNVIKTAHHNGYYIYVNSNPQSASTSHSGNYYADGNWHLIIGVFDTTGVALYVDNMATPVCSGSTTATGKVCNSVLSIGGLYNQGYYSFNGDLSEFIMENKAWTEQERTDYYNQTKSNYGL